MADKIYVKISSLSDIYELLPNLRNEDLNEIYACGLTPEISLLRGFLFSKTCYSAKFRGKTIAIFGFSDLDLNQHTGSIWLLGSNELTKHPITLVKEGKRYVKEFLKKYDVLVNAVDKRNIIHINWLKRIGMTISDSVYINGYEFLKFFMKKKEVKNV